MIQFIPIMDANRRNSCCWPPMPIVRLIALLLIASSCCLFTHCEGFPIKKLYLDGNDWIFRKEKNSSELILLANCCLNNCLWWLSKTGLTGSATVPGGIYTDLRRARILPEDPFTGFNDMNYRWVSKSDWIYQKKFNGQCQTYAINMKLTLLDCAINCLHSKNSLLSRNPIN